MKRIIIPAFLLLAFCCCSRERQTAGLDMPMLTRGFIDLEVAREHTSADSVGDEIRSVRFIVFTDLYTYPKAEVNERRDVTASNGASALKAVLEVSRRENGENDKLLVVIANEPASLSGALTGVHSIEDLADIEMEMSRFVSDDHLSLRPDSLMPMSGAVWTSRSDVYPTAAEAGNNRVPLSLDRSVARVDVYLNTDLAGGVQIAAGSTVTLGNTYTQSYFIRHGSGERVLGKIQTVEDGALTSKTWTQTGASLDVPEKTDTPSSVRVCTFYTPERNCVSGKLRIEVGVKIPGDDGLKGGGIVLNTANDEEGIAHPVDTVRRNTVYKVTATIGANGITGVVQGWNSEEINIGL